MLKTCSKCGMEKLTSEFFVKDSRTGRLHAQCKACYKNHRQSYYADHYRKYHDQYLARAKRDRERLRETFRANMLSYLSDKACAHCGEDDIRVLEFDHIDPAQKGFSISRAVRLGKSWDEIMTELNKCQVLCANCHKRRTAEQFGWHKAKSNGGAYQN